MLRPIESLGAHIGFLPNIAYRWKKSKKVRRLQLVIAPLGPRDVVTDILGGTGKRDPALKEYLDLCIADGGARRHSWAVTQMRGGRDERSSVLCKTDAFLHVSWVSP